MATNEERREVAERLREAAVDDGHVGMPYGKQGFQVTLRRIIGTSNPNRPTLYARLADLIDPTTTVHVEDNLNESEGHGDAWEVCDACGGIMCVLTDVGNELVPGYCPCCGARVVSHDDN